MEKRKVYESKFEKKQDLKEWKKGEKVFYQRDRVGGAKYTINFHDGKKTHNDGSPFFDIAIFKNKKDLWNFITKLIKDGYKYQYSDYEG